MAPLVDPGKINEWRSIVTLIVFVLANLAVLFPFHIPIPKSLANGLLDIMSWLRIIPSRQELPKKDGKSRQNTFRRFPVNFVTAPLIADIFLLAILAIGRDEVYDGTIGSYGISPVNIMAFFITLAYIAISIDASGLIRYLAFRVVDKGGKYGQRLFISLYIFFFGLGSFIGNDPIVLSGTAFLAYMTRISNNIRLPTAWIHTQFAVANTASAILVSSNPTNLVLAGAFQIKFVVYTLNMIVPVVITAIVLLPFLLYIVFNSESLIPYSIKLDELPEDRKKKKPINPNIPNARDSDIEREMLAGEDRGRIISLEEVMNPFIDKKSAGFGAIIMATTLITILAVNGRAQDAGEIPVCYVTLPAAFVMLCWDLIYGWLNRHETRDIARRGEMASRALAQRKRETRENQQRQDATEPIVSNLPSMGPESADTQFPVHQDCSTTVATANNSNMRQHPASKDTSGDGDSINSMEIPQDKQSVSEKCQGKEQSKGIVPSAETPTETQEAAEVGIMDNGQASGEKNPSGEIDLESLDDQRSGKQNLAQVLARTYKWAQVTFPTVMAVLRHLPFALVPFALSMFVLVQALETKGWVDVFAYGWDHWVNQTGVIGAIGGMGFLSVILCNFAGTNIGTTILLSRMIIQWTAIHKGNGIPISDRMFWGTVYSMALGVNFGAYSTAFSASLAGLLWRDILARKNIPVTRAEFARVNLPIIAVAMTVGCTVLIGEIHIYRTEAPYSL